jgi:hypothetical protein
LDIILLYLTLLIGFLVVTQLGKFLFESLYQEVLNNIYTKLLTYFMSGFLGLIFLFSIFTTQGKSVFILLPIWLIIQKGGFKSFRIKLSLNLIEKELLQIAFLLSIPIFLYQFSLYSDFFQLRFIVPHYDFAFYAQLSDSFLNFGNENKGLYENVLFPKEFNGVAPYHYPEIWFTAFVSKCFHIDSLKALLFVAFPAIRIAVVAGLFSMFQFNQKSKKTQQVFFVLLLFITPVFFEFFLRSEYTKYYLGFTQSGVFSYFGNKYQPIYLVAILATKLYYSGRTRDALIVLLLSGLFSIGTLPAIGATVSLMYMYHTKSFKRTIPVILFLLTIPVFYKLFSVSNVTTYLKKTILVQKIIAEPTQIIYYKTALFALVFPYLRLIIFYFPFIIIIWFNRTRLKFKSISGVLVFAVMLTAIGASSAALLTGMLDAGQLLYNCLPIVNVLFIYHLSNINIKWPMIAVLLILVSGSFINNFQNKFSNGANYNIYQASFTSDALQMIDEGAADYELVAFSMSEKNYRSGVNASRYNTPCFFMNLATKPCYFVDVNTFRFDQYFKESDFANAKNEIKNYRQQHLLSDQTEAEVQYQFLRDNKARFLVIQDSSVISTDLLKSLNCKRSLKDSLTGDIIYELIW